MLMHYSEDGVTTNCKLSAQGESGAPSTNKFHFATCQFCKAQIPYVKVPYRTS